MSDPTNHQRDIIQAMLLGLDIEFLERTYKRFSNDLEKEEWEPSSVKQTLHALSVHGGPERLRIAPGQEVRTVRRYGNAEIPCPLFGSRFKHDTHYIDINPESGSICGGKL